MGDLNQRVGLVQRLFRPKAGRLSDAERPGLHSHAERGDDQVSETIGAEFIQHAVRLPFGLGHGALPHSYAGLQIRLVFGLGQPLPAVVPIARAPWAFFRRDMALAGSLCNSG